MNRISLTEMARRIATSLNIESIIASEEQIEEQIKSYPALWIKPAEIIEGSLTTGGRVCSELCLTLLIEASHNRYTNQADLSEKGLTLLLGIARELAQEDEILLIENPESSIETKAFTAHTALAVGLTVEITTREDIN
ncbi:MAG: hypothetical protein SNH88_07140 [Rikenellaceae bacterium]